MLLDREKVTRAFDQYVSDYNADDPKIRLKIDHTYRVAALCEQIGQAVPVGDTDLVWLCGMLHDRLPIAEVPAMTNADYRAAGCTALIDALGDAIRHIVSIHRYARPEDIPAHTIFVVTTDGMENASHKYSSDQVKKMITHEQEKYGWEFIFLAANIDAVETAGRYGIRGERAVNYRDDSLGTTRVYESINHAVRAVRSGRSLDEEHSWRENADRDFHKRGN